MSVVETEPLDEKLIITNYQGQVLSALLQNGKPVEIRLDSSQENQFLGNIYVGKVKNILTNIQAAFVEIANGLPCYYSLEDNKHPFFTKKGNCPRLAAGDELLVQVSREGMKSKAPTVTSELSLPGKYVVLTRGKNRIGLSSKLLEKERTRLNELMMPYLTHDYGWIVRTNAKESQDQEIQKEAEMLIASYSKLLSTAEHRTSFSCVYRSPADYLITLRDTYSAHLSKIITDDPKLFDSIRLYLEHFQPEDLHLLSKYEDALLPLSKLYNLDGALKDALKERVWLKSGAYLVIQPTEALTSIDVNTGKFVGKKKDQEETFFKINLEAAKEIARQVRLRNLSGILIIDFINLQSEEKKKMLLKNFQGYLRQDPVKTTLVDMTPLNLVEVTRKKIRKPLSEQAAGLVEG